MKGHIPDDQYKTIHEVMPIPCVDVVIVHEDSFLMAKRNNKPAQGQWWVPGGRVLKDESLTDCAKRKSTQETGLQVNVIRMLGADETMFPDGPFGSQTHTINVVFLASPALPNTEISLDSQNTEYRWFNAIDDSWHPYIQKYLSLAGFTRSTPHANL